MDKSKLKVPLFWIGLLSAVYNAVVHAGITAGIKMPWWIGAIGVGLSAILVYCQGNNTNLKDKDKKETPL